MGTKNTMIDLNDHLFLQLERLGDEDLTQEELENECKRANAIANVARQIVANANTVLKAQKLKYDTGENLDNQRLYLGDKK